MAQDPFGLSSLAEAFKKPVLHVLQTQMAIGAAMMETPAGQGWKAFEQGTSSAFFAATGHFDAAKEAAERAIDAGWKIVTPPHGLIPGS